MYFLPFVSCLGTGTYAWYRSKDASSLALPLRLSSYQRSSDQLSGWSRLFTPDKSVSSRVSRTSGGRTGFSSSKWSAFTSVVAARQNLPQLGDQCPQQECQPISFLLLGVQQQIFSAEVLLLLLAVSPHWDPLVRQEQLRLHAPGWQRSSPASALRFSFGLLLFLSLLRFFLCAVAGRCFQDTVTHNNFMRRECESHLLPFELCPWHGSRRHVPRHTF